MSAHNITSKQSACPSCEYQHGTKGKPVLEHGLMKCQDCGSTWRELGNSLEHILKDTAYEAKADKNFDSQPENYHDEKAQQNTSLFASSSQQEQLFSTLKKWSIIAPIAGFLLITTVIFTSVYLTYNVNQKHSNATRADQIQISKVDVTERMSSRGKKVFTVKGQLQNRSNETKRIPRITIILRQTNGREVVRWNYNSPKQTISSGKELTFASSIQYDTPYVAYAEAIFN